jgi:hypothetical protein
MSQRGRRALRASVSREVVDGRNRPGPDQAPPSLPNAEAAPAGRLTIEVRQHPCRGVSRVCAFTAPRRPSRVDRARSPDDIRQYWQQHGAVGCSLGRLRGDFHPEQLLVRDGD